MIQKHDYCSNELAIDQWPYWQFEETIIIINELIEEEEKQRKKSDDQQQNTSMPNFNPSSYMRDVSNMTNKFK